MAQNPLSSAEVFLKIADQFRLGDLPTEQSHPLTVNLSAMSRTDVEEALARVKKIDLQVLEVLKTHLGELEDLRKSLQRVRAAGGRIFIGGCGATGRLALTLETIHLESEAPSEPSVLAFMAGGDVALVHAIEGFEDHPEYGARQLMELGFREDDMLICCTEGGETPFVIGAALKAAELSRYPVAFMFCNPRSILEKKLERCRQVFAHPNIQAYELTVGPMALCGSTRLQASTILMAAVGLCLFADSFDALTAEWESLYKAVTDLDYSALKEFIRAEASAYAEGRRVIYSVDELAISVFTDTTERAPTFSLQAFQNEIRDEKNEVEPSWSFIECRNVTGVESAWRKILKRAPRALGWGAVNPKTGGEYLLSFDFSAGAEMRRRERWPQFDIDVFSIDVGSEVLRWSFRGRSAEFAVGGLSLLARHLVLKLLLNTHSTLMMGLLDRYEGNWMTFVHPTNAKLVDRASRYVIGILAKEGIEASYENVVRALFAKMPFEKKGPSLVLELVADFKKNR